MLRPFITRLAATWVVPLALWLFSPHTVSAAAAAIFDDLNEPAAWTGPVFQYGNPATGTAWFTNGVLTIRHSPVGRWHTVSMSRTLETDPRQGLWVHFRFRIKEMLLGADLYATVSFGNEMVLQMGVNGEQHWIQGGACQEKDFDDELFWGSNVIVGGVVSLVGGSTNAAETLVAFPRLSATFTASVCVPTAKGAFVGTW